MPGHLRNCEHASLSLESQCSLNDILTCRTRPQMPLTILVAFAFWVPKVVPMCLPHNSRSILGYDLDLFPKLTGPFPPWSNKVFFYVTFNMEHKSTMVVLAGIFFLLCSPQVHVKPLDLIKMICTLLFILLAPKSYLVHCQYAKAL